MVKKFSNILAFGDSHVAGCELTDIAGLNAYLEGRISLEEADWPGKQLAFPQIVAEHLDIPCHNFAMTGGSNDRSIRRLCTAAKEFPNSLVLFCYTCTDRTEFYYPDEGTYLGRDNFKFMQVGMQWTGGIEHFIKRSPMTHPINKTFVKEILRPYNNLEQMMFLAETICMRYNCEIMHIPLFPEDLPEGVKCLDFDGYGNYLSWAEAKKFKKLPHLHYDLIAHKAFADLIIKELE
jgi:hypothetical protein